MNIRAKGNALNCTWFMLEEKYFEHIDIPLIDKCMCNEYSTFGIFLMGNIILSCMINCPE